MQDANNNNNTSDNDNQVAESESSEKKKKNIPFDTDWSELLVTPKDNPLLSPALAEVSMPGYHAQQQYQKQHGLGLLLTTDRARMLTRYGRRGVALLLEVATLYDQFAQSILRAGQALPPLLGSRRRSSSTLSIQESMVSWSGEMNKLSVNIRTAIAMPLQGFLVTHGETINGLEQRYRQSRQNCVQARQRAIIARKKYLKAQKDVELLASNVEVIKAEGGDASVNMSTTTSTSTSMPPSPTTPPRKLMNKVTELRYRESKYRRAVSIENSCISQCERLEEMALESLQNVEEDRLLIMLHSLARVMSAKKDALSEITIILKENFEEQQGSTENNPSKDKKDKITFATFLKTPGPTEEASGMMDAETLGLPEEIGKLRDEFRALVAGRSAHFQGVRALATFLESVAQASEKLGNGLSEHLSKTNFGSTSNPSNSLESLEGSKTFEQWSNVLGVLELEAEGAVSLAHALRSVRSKKLDKVLLEGERATKAAADFDDAMWKQVCEAARSRTRAETKYKQTTSQSAKVRERARSYGSDYGSDLTPLTVNAHVSKSLVNVFSILPDGGDQAMKMLGASARASVAQRSLVDADQKETKDRQALNTAVEAISRLLEAYTKSTKTVIAQYTEEEVAGCLDIIETLRAFVSCVEEMRISRRQDLTARKLLSEQLILEDVQNDFNQWTTIVQSSVKDSYEQNVDLTTDSDLAYKLELQLPKTDVVPFAISEIETVIPESVSFDEELDMEEDETLAKENSGTIGQPEKNGASPNPAEPAPSIFDNQAAKWMKQLSVPRERSNSGTLSLKEKLNLKKMGQKPLVSGAADTETDVFLTCFWPESVDPQDMPPILSSFSCSFRDSSQRLPFQYGRLFITGTRLLFVSWTGKKLALKWGEVLAIEPIKNFLNTHDDTLMVSCKKGSADESYMFLGSFCNRAAATEMITKAIEEAKSALNDLASDSVSAQEVGTREDVAPDDTLSRMDCVLSRHLKNISIRRFYDIVWAEGNGTEFTPLYRPWLEKACFDVEVGDWERTDCVGPWCGEQYGQKRSVNFKVQRKTHLYIGPPIANVKQTHYCRIENNDKCVVKMRVEFDGIPYSDCFAVEVRWVARRQGNADILVEVGVFVDFVKSTILKGKIRSGTLEETTIVHQDLFETVKNACIAAGGEGVEEPTTITEDVVKQPSMLEEATRRLFSISGMAALYCFLVLLSFLWRKWFATQVVPLEEELHVPKITEEQVLSLQRRFDHMEAEIKFVKEALAEVLELLKADRLREELG